jgi:hypothetical protein
MDDRHSKIEKKKKKTLCRTTIQFWQEKKKTNLSEFEPPTGCKPVKLLATAIAAIFMPKLLPANKPSATSVAHTLHQNHAQQTTAKTPTSAIATSEGAGNSAFKSNSTDTSSCCKLCEEFRGSRVVQKLSANFEEEGSGGGRKREQVKKR